MAFDAGAVIGRLELGLEGWKKSVETVKADQQSMTGFAMRHGQEIQDLGKKCALAGAAITAALSAVVLTTSRAGDEFDEMSARSGISTETLSTLKLAADKSGTSLDSVTRGLKFLAAQMLETSTAGDKSKTVLGAMGIEATDATGKLRPMNEVLFEAADKFKRMEDGAVKIRLAVALFGRAGMDLIPILNLGSDGLKKNEEAARRLGIEWSGPSAKAAAMFRDGLIDLRASGAGLNKELGEALMPVVQKFVEHATDAIVKVKDWARENPELSKSILSFAGAAGVALTAVGTLLIVIGTLAKNLQALKISASVPIIITVGIAGGVALAKALEEIREFYEKNVSHRYIAQEDRDWQALIRTLGEWSTIAESIHEAYVKQNGYSVESGKILGQLDGLWQKYGNSSREAMEAILKGEAGPKVRQLLIDLMNAHGGAAQLAGVHAEATDKVKKAAVALDPALQAILDSLDKSGDKSKTLADKLGELAKETEATYKSTDKLALAFNAASKSGKVTTEDLKPVAERLIELAAAMNNHVSPAVAKIIEDFKKQKKETDLVTAAIEDLGKAIDELKKPFKVANEYTVDLWLTFLKQERATVKLDDSISDLQKALNSYSAGEFLSQIELMLVATNQLWEEAQRKGKPAQWMPDPKDVNKRILELKGIQEAGGKDFVKAVESFMHEVSTVVSDALKNIAKSIVDSFGLVESLAYKPIDYDLSGMADYFKRVYKDLNANYENQKHFLDLENEASKHSLDVKYEDSKSALDKEYEAQIDLINSTITDEKQKNDALRKAKEDHLAKEKELEEKHYQDEQALEEKNYQDLKTLAEWFAGEQDRIRKDEDAARQKHADDEEKRQKSLWENVKKIFGTIVEEMATIWLTRLIAKIIPSLDDVGKSIEKNISKSLEGAGGAAGSMASSFLSAAGSIANIVTAIASVLSLLKGADKQTDVTYWLKLMWADGKELHDWVINLPEAYLNNFYNFFSNIETHTRETVEAIKNIPSHQTGGYVPETGLALLHAGEFIVPPNGNQGFVNAAVPAMAMPGGSGPVNNYYLNLTIPAIDGPSVKRFFDGPASDRIQEIFRQNKKGLTRNLNRYLEAMG